MMIKETPNGRYVCWIGNYSDMRDRFVDSPALVRIIETAWTVANFAGETYQSYFGKDNKIHINCFAGDSIITLGFKQE
jgi:hypothetical protein